MSKHADADCWLDSVPDEREYSRNGRSLHDTLRLISAELLDAERLTAGVPKIAAVRRAACTVMLCAMYWATRIFHTFRYLAWLAAA